MAVRWRGEVGGVVRAAACQWSPLELELAGHDPGSFPRFPRHPILRSATNTLDNTKQSALAAVPQMPRVARPCWKYV
jgi:hypothetical protein